MGNVVYMTETPAEMSRADRKRKVDEMMTESVYLLESMITHLEHVETYLTSPEARRQIKLARNTMIDAAVIGCGAVSEEFDKHS